MKRTFTIALGLVLSAAFVSSAFAQDAFPDTPENHWAYEALANMKKAGLLVGYPDGLYRGSRPASRYEMAVALYALYQHLRGLADGFDSRIKTLEDKVNGMGDNGEIAQLKQMLEAMRGELNGMKAWGDDIANLKKMAATFEKELASMGVDVEALKKSVNDLADRVTKLEKRKPAVDIHGSVTALMLGGYSDDGEYGITVDGRPTGVSHGTGAPSGIDRDLNFFHEGQVVMTGTNDEGPKWKAALNIGNMLDGGSFGDGGPDGGFSQWTTQTGAAFWDGGVEQVYFQEFNAWWDFSLGGQSGSFKMGRMGTQAGSYFFKRPDTTPYFSNEYWDNGDWMFDGGSLSFNWGSTSLNIWGGRSSHRETTNGDDIQVITGGQYWNSFEPGSDRPRGLGEGLIEANTVMGAGLGIKLGSKGSLNLNYIMLNQDDTTSFFTNTSVTADRAVIFGGELNFGIGNWMLNAGYSQSDVNLGESSVIDSDNSAYWASLGTKNDKWGVNVGWRHIDPLFNAPGDWGRIGIWWNPNDIEGFWLKGNFNLNDKLAIHASAEMYEGTDTPLFGSSTFDGLSSDDQVTSYKLDLLFSLTDSVSLWLGGEWVNWDLAARAAPRGGFAGGETDERWYNVGIRYRMTDKAWWSLKWQMSDYDSNGTSGMNPFSFFSGSDVAKGGIITSTLGIKF